MYESLCAGPPVRIRVVVCWATCENICKHVRVVVCWATCENISDVNLYRMHVPCLCALPDSQMVSYVWWITTPYYNSSVAAHNSPSSSSPSPPRCASWNLFLHHHWLAQLPIWTDWVLASSWIGHYCSHWSSASCRWLGMGQEVQVIKLIFSVKPHCSPNFFVFTLISIESILDVITSAIDAAKISCLVLHLCVTIQINYAFIFVNYHYLVSHVSTGVVF
jgi:hypothetical protein